MTKKDIYNWLEINKVSLTIKWKKILDDLTFSLPKGTSLGFIWDNGAWKTTTIKILAWINEPDSGNIYYNGLSVFETKGWNKVGFLPEKTYFPQYMTWREFINVIAELQWIKDFDIEGLFSELKILHAIDKKIETYSKWMMQRLWFVSLLINDKMEYLLLDEPMSGLDHVWQMDTIDIILKLKKRGITILITSHHMNEIEVICDKIAFIRQWKIIDESTVKDILSEYPSLKDYYLYMASTKTQD